MPKPPKTPPKVTPAMQQFFRFKEEHPGCVLFFRMGDFYEMFYDDAQLAHRVLGVTLTQRSEGVPMAGVPYHAVEGYLRRMIQAGHRVAVCDQVEDAKHAKGVVKRDVTRVVTPGTLTDEILLTDETVNPLAAVQFHADDMASLAWCELSTGAFQLATLEAGQVGDELARISPRELLYCEAADGEVPTRVKAISESLNAPLAARPAWTFRQGEAIEALKRQYQVQRLAGFGLEDTDPAIGAAGAVMHYLLETQRTTDHGRLAHLQPPKRFERAAHLVIDQTSLRSLEVTGTLRTGDVSGSLLGTLRGCVTAMGKRLLRQWLCYPLIDRVAIEQRQAVVESLVVDSRFLDEIRTALDEVHDLPRILARLAVGRATPRDLVALGRSSDKITDVERALSQRPNVAGYHKRVDERAASLKELGQLIRTACDDAPPAHLREGGLIRDGHDAQLDEHRGHQRDGHTWLASYQKSLAEQTGIGSLKVGYNKVFGYYIEITAANREKVKDDDAYFQSWTRKQTLKNAERYITPELKEYEGKVLGAGERAVAREQLLFDRLCASAAQKMRDVQAYADVLAELDVLACFAERAVRLRYVKPELVDEPSLLIEGGRHPVLDELLGDRFVPNDVSLGVRHEHDIPTLALITGPNMAGKSTYIRQTALIALLAHTGSFVPADRAVVGLVDRIFTRIGASDELHTGQSTFMVEMTETANLCHHATDKSLIILDEIGRGTSTLDGLSLAWAIAEHLAVRKSRCLFATHYHELTSLAESHENVTNLNVTVREWQDEVVFLHRIARGATDRSYGIHVAKIAGLPGAIVDRANQLLTQLAVSHAGPVATAGPAATDRGMTPLSEAQLPLFTEYVEHPALDELRSANIEKMSPLDAFDLLRRLADQLGTQVSKKDIDANSL